MSRQTLNGLHHVTAVTGDLRANEDFYTRTLGLQVLRRPERSTEHCGQQVYGVRGPPRAGGILTFLHYPGAVPGRPAGGMAHRILWRVGSPTALDFWLERLESEAIGCARRGQSVWFEDPEGLGHALICGAACAGGHTSCRGPGIPPGFNLRGLAGFRGYSSDPVASARVLCRLLGARPGPAGRWTVRGPTRSAIVSLDSPRLRVGRQGGGTIHHVGWAAEQPHLCDWARWLDDIRLDNTGVVDRDVFQSVYFAEPGGMLWSLASGELSPA